MAVLAINGRLITENAGPQWHLVGEVTRDRSQRNRLTLTRPADQLSGRIRAAGGQLLPAVQLTDTTGTSAKLLGVQVSGFTRLPNRGTTAAGASKGGNAGKGSSELDRIDFTFQQIEITHKSSKTNKSSDDWTSPP